MTIKEVARFIKEVSVFKEHGGDGEEYDMAIGEIVQCLGEELKVIF